ncbi:hypothetical protein Nepgr_008606 [Nepenthes gracilis]|uniref:Uncharacterized protein n=1 Tax=Nepenthes gracilis TaxID=150966 RepID=A0AAD3XJL5_NEPGR|nr:hypothetical protein Nepgr_008606 [Nepenthes gracilis]
MKLQLSHFLTNSVAIEGQVKGEAPACEEGWWLIGKTTVGSNLLDHYVLLRLMMKLSGSGSAGKERTSVKLALFPVMEFMKRPMKFFTALSDFFSLLAMWTITSDNPPLVCVRCRKRLVKSTVAGPGHLSVPRNRWNGQGGCACGCVSLDVWNRRESDPVVAAPCTVDVGG